MSKLNLGTSLILDTDYSTSEVKTGATWINGKPIYRKVITFTGDSVQLQSVAHGISNLGVVIEYFCWFGEPNNGRQRFVNFNYYADATWNCGFYVTPSTLVFEKGTSWATNYTNKPCWAILYYTKTTD